jgi:hypothetical protein
MDTGSQSPRAAEILLIFGDEPFPFISVCNDLGSGSPPLSLLAFLRDLSTANPNTHWSISERCREKGINVPPTVEQRLDANREARRQLAARLEREAEAGPDVLTDAEWGTLGALMSRLQRAKD